MAAVGVGLPVDVGRAVGVAVVLTRGVRLPIGVAVVLTRSVLLPIGMAVVLTRGVLLPIGMAVVLAVSVFSVGRVIAVGVRVGVLAPAVTVSSMASRGAVDRQGTMPDSG